MKTNNEIYDFADNQINQYNPLIPRIPKDEWIKWLSEKQYSEPEIEQLKRKIQLSVFGQCVCEDDYKCIRCKQLNKIHEIFKELSQSNPDNF